MTYQYVINSKFGCKITTFSANTVRNAVEIWHIRGQKQAKPIFRTSLILIYADIVVILH